MLSLVMVSSDPLDQKGLDSKFLGAGAPLGGIIGNIIVSAEVTVAPVTMSLKLG